MIQQTTNHQLRQNTKKQHFKSMESQDYENLAGVSRKYKIIQKVSENSALNKARL